MEGRQMSGLKIIGLGRALPKKKVHNDDLAQMMETSDEWIFTRTGIHERRFCEKDESATTLAIRAAKEACQNAGIRGDELGAIVVASMSSDFATPSMACLVAASLSAEEDCVSLDISAACSGFVYGLEVARGLLSASPKKKALVIGTEQLSRLLKMEDRTTAVLFGDGAGACVVEESTGLYAAFLGSRGDFSIVAPGIYTGAFDGFYEDGSEEKEKLGQGATAGKHQKIDHLLMDGKEVFLFAIDIIPKCIEAVLKKTGDRLEDVDYVVCHQANSRIIRNVVRHMKADKAQFFEDMEHFGNTSGASIPMALKDMEEQGKLQNKAKLLLVGFGAGLTFGSVEILYERRES